jgi:hypothetical protein
MYHCLFLDVLIFFVPVKFCLLLKTKDSSQSESTQVKIPDIRHDLSFIQARDSPLHPRDSVLESFCR